MSDRIASVMSVAALAVAWQFTPGVAAAQTKVDLSAIDNLYGIGTVGVPVTGHGIDTGGHAYAASLLGTSLKYNGASFTIPAAGPNTAVQSKKISLPAGKFATLSFLGTGVNGNHPNQTFVVSYGDGTTKTYTQGLSDWTGNPAKYAGETTVITTSFEITASGAKNPRLVQSLRLLTESRQHKDDC